MLFLTWIYRLNKPEGIFRKGRWGVYLNALQLNSNALFVFDGAVLGLSELVGQSHILQLQMFHNTNLSHLSSLEGKKQNNNKHFRSTLWKMSGLDEKENRISINLTCMLAISLCSRTLASWATDSCCWYHCLSCWSESISAWEVFSRLCRVLRSSWTC